MDIPCTQIFNRAGADIKVYDGILNSECSILYRDDVRMEIIRLRNADDNRLGEYNEESARKRTAWFQENKARFEFISSDF